MKKNLLSVVILALVFVNFVLTAMLMFTVLPQTKKANAMIEAVCAAIDLELKSGAGDTVHNIPTANVAEYKLNEGETMTINLAMSDDDDEQRYAVLTVTLSYNTKSDGFKEFGEEGIKAKEGQIMNNINEVIRHYTKEEFDANVPKVQREILEDLQAMFGSDFIVAVNFPKINTN